MQPPALPRVAAIAIVAAVVGSCVEVVSTPLFQGTAAVTVTVALPPGTPAVWIPIGDTLRVAVRRAGLQTPIVDSVMQIGGELSAALEVPLSQEIERFLLSAQIEISGFVYFLAFEPVELRVGGDTTIALIAQYVGPAAGAASLDLSPTEPTVAPSDSTQLIVVVLDSVGDVISNPPVRYRSQEPLVADVDSLGVATVPADAPGDTAFIEAFLPTGVTSGTVLRVERGAVEVATLNFSGGGGQVGAPGQPLTDSLIIEADDVADGRVAGEGLVAGALISFTVVSGGGSVSPASVITDANGRAAVQWTLGPVIGDQILEASAAGASPVQTSSLATNPFATMEIESGDDQEALPLAVLPDSLTVRVLDAGAQPVAGVVVDFAVSFGGSVSPFRVITGANGLASTQLTLGSTLGPEVVTAFAYRTVGLETVTFSANSGNSGSMATNRFEHQATLLLDGTVLVTGGYANFSASPITATAERYDTASRAFTATGSMAQVRWDHTATLLYDGRVLVAGGGFNSSPFPAVSSTELYDPVTGTFSPAGTMIGCTFTVACGGMRRNHTATRLFDGRVLIAGGHFTVGNGLGALSVAELYDPVLGTFTQTAGPMTWQHSFHAATLLDDGRVLITGGENSPFSGAITIASTFSPTTRTFTAAGPMTQVRNRHTATRLLDGRVLVVGGFSPVADLFDPATNTFTATGSLQTARIWHEATLLPDGRVLISGGSAGAGGNQRYASTEIYDPATGLFTAGPTMLSVRVAHQAILIGTRVLLIGGIGSGGGPVQSSELLSPSGPVPP